MPAIAPVSPEPERRTTASSLAYMPGLDVLRGLAILMVLVLHGLAPDNGAVFRQYHSTAMAYLETAIDAGQYGVHLFFVLSGLLITGILLDSRKDDDYYSNFFLRRVLRILPAYLVMIAALLSFHLISWRYVGVCLLYLCNMPGLLGAGPEYGPFWSLSVEEQFYLLWPFTVRKLSVRKLAWLVLLILVLTPVLRFALLHVHGSLHDYSKKTWGVADFFAAGAMLAICRRSSRARPHVARAAAPLLLLGIALFASSLLWHPSDHIFADLQTATSLDAWLFLFSGLVIVALQWPRIAQVRLAKPLIFLAKISYGLYLCHEVIFSAVLKYWPFPPVPGLGPFPQLCVQFVAAAAVAIGVATLSRYTLEEFFLRLKPRHHRSAANRNNRGHLA